MFNTLYTAQLAILTGLILLAMWASVAVLDIVVSVPGEIMTDVPPVDSTFIVEIKISDKDIGFVKKEQGVRVKINAFPFTKYGSIAGEIFSISKNPAKENNKTHYLAQIELPQNFVEYKGERYALLPGMTVMADIKTGNRTVLNYALKPIVTALEQAFAER